MKTRIFSFGNLLPLINACLIMGIVYLHLHGNAPIWRFVFILFAACERVYETFYTSREQNRENLQGDWTLLAVVVVYMMAFYGSFYNYYLARPLILKWIILTGLILYSCSLVFRWVAIFSLRGQWGIHSVEQDRLGGDRELIRSGPYRYMRHPYYFFVCIEIISIPLIMGANWALLLAVFIVCPLEIFRGYLEEKHLLNTFGWAYLKYKHERAGFFPMKKLENFNRREIDTPIEFVDRRTSSP